MKYLFFDTETTGLPVDHSPASKFSGIWPNLVSMAWILADDTGTTLHSEYHIVKPAGWTIPESSTKIHKITQETAERYGMALNEVIERFMWYVVETDVIVAHNLHFDKNVVNNALRWQLGKVLMLEDYSKRMFCTMQEGKSVVGKPCKSPNKFRCVKLSDMYKTLFGTDPVGMLHNAMTDTQILMQCFYKIWGTPCDIPEVLEIKTDLPITPLINLINASASSPVLTTLKVSFDASEAV